MSILCTKIVHHRACIIYILLNVKMIFLKFSFSKNIKLVYVLNLMMVEISTPRTSSTDINKDSGQRSGYINLN